MKKILLALLLLLVCYNLASARILRVNNTPGSSAEYSSAINAYNDANAGDTIQLEGSKTEYESVFEIAKRLVWIGPGYFLSDNPKTQFNKDSAVWGGGIFSAGSEGSVVMGITGGLYYLQADNITIQRNNNIEITIGGISTSALNKATIAQNFNATIDTISNGFTFTNVNIYNNVINKVALSNGISGSMYNNVLINNIDSLGGFTLVNNIIHGDESNTYNCAFSYNILYNGTDSSPDSNGNFYVSDFSTIFNDWANNTTTDGNLELKSGSPATGAGQGGKDMGAFGGGTPYVLSGMPPVPSVYAIQGPTNNTVPTDATSMQITVSIKSHN